MDGIYQVPKGLIGKPKSLDRVADKAVTAYQKAEAKSSDQVDLSDKAREIFRLRKAYDQLAEVDQKKVNYFREQIANGEYKPLSREIVVEMFDPILPK